MQGALYITISVTTAFSQPNWLSIWMVKKEAFTNKSLSAFRLNIELIPMCMQCKDATLPCSIVALGLFCFICAVHLWIILSVIILIKQLDFHQFNYIILGHFPCCHHYFNILSLRHSSVMSGILYSGELCMKDDIPVTGLRFSDPATGETRLDPKFEGTGKALLGQHLQAKGDTISTKVSDWLSEQQPGNVLKGLRWKGVVLKHRGAGVPRQVGTWCSWQNMVLHTSEVSFVC